MRVFIGAVLAHLSHRKCRDPQFCEMPGPHSHHLSILGKWRYR